MERSCKEGQEAAVLSWREQGNCLPACLTVCLVEDQPVAVIGGVFVCIHSCGHLTLFGNVLLLLLRGRPLDHYELLELLLWSKVCWAEPRVNDWPAS